MLSKDGLCLPWAYTSSLPLGEAGPGLPTLLPVPLLQATGGGDFCPVAPPQSTGPLHKGSARRGWGSTGVCAVRWGPGQTPGTCSWMDSPALPSAGARSHGGLGRGSVLVGAGEVGSPVLGAGRRVPLPLPLAGAGWAPAPWSSSPGQMQRDQPPWPTSRLLLPEYGPSTPAEPHLQRRAAEKGPGGRVCSWGQALGLG